MSSPKKKEANSRRRNRSYDQRSPLDKLPEPAQHELRRRLQAHTTLREIQAWLSTAHGCAISQTSISEWWLRKQADENAEIVAGKAHTARGQSEGFEIIVIAPGATEVRLEIRPLKL